MGARRPFEAVLTFTHILCFAQRYENNQKCSTEKCHFYSRKKSQYIAWACFRNAISTAGTISLLVLTCKWTPVTMERKTWHNRELFSDVFSMCYYYELLALH